MLIPIGSTNRVKVAAVMSCLQRYEEIIPNPAFLEVVVPPLYSGQPLSLVEIMDGAAHRAKQAFRTNTPCFSFGIESGLFPVPHTRTGYMDITACIIYDGKEEYSGLSSAFEQPEEVTRHAVEKRIEISEGWRACGFTEARKIGEEQGSIYEVSCGRIDRMAYTQEAIFHALDALRNQLQERFHVR